MNKSTLHLIWLGLFISLLSIGNFFSLLLHIPIYLLAVLMAAAGVLSFRYIVRHTRNETTGTISRPAFYVLGGGIALLTAACVLLVRKHGDTDAVGNWNFASKFLADPAHWRQLLWYGGADAHPDYPMGYYGATSFFWRLLGNETLMAPLGISLFATVAIPVMIFLEVSKRHLGVATLLLLLLVVHPYYLNCGLNQYADTLLSFYILSAILCINQFRQSGNRVWLLLCSASLGAALWVKNEGIFTCALFGLFYFKTFLSKNHLRYTIGGALPFVLALGVFRLGFAPANDIAAVYETGGNTGITSLITDKERYKLIVSFMKGSFDNIFSMLKLLTMVYLGYSILVQKNLSRNFYLLAGIFACYLFVYLITPRNLQWHLATSFDRLVVQLYPSALLVIGLALSEIKLPATFTSNK
ncbi:MAG: hypothetical protein JNL72_01345 [Flavipsychrobacter sp.]|nr:hypothetical protein [Flavipsychrobacter sp.]